MTAPNATARSRARYARAADIIGAVTLDAEHAAAFAAILKRTDAPHDKHRLDEMLDALAQ